MSLAKIWVFVDSVNGVVTPGSLELLSAASDFANEVVGFSYSGDEQLIAMAANFGAQEIAVATRFSDSLVGTVVASIMERRIKDGDQPSAIFFGATSEGRDCAARLSAKLDQPVLSNIMNLELVDGVFFAEHAIFGGTEIARTRFTGNGPGIFVIRAKTFEAIPKGFSSPLVVEVAAGDLGPTGIAQVVESHSEARSGPNLDEAEVVVSGGRGLGQPENYRLVERLAQLLHGAPGASRAIVDSGWVPYAHQVGQTGKTVKPTVYIACAISGATQHMVGMKGSKNIIAINKDSDAPIFSISDLGIVGDVQKILPQLIEALEER